MNKRKLSTAPSSIGIIVCAAAAEWPVGPLDPSDSAWIGIGVARHAAFCSQTANPNWYSQSECQWCCDHLEPLWGNLRGDWLMRFGCYLGCHSTFAPVIAEP